MTPKTKQVLEALQAESKPVTMTELLAKVPMARASMVNILLTLRVAGLARQDGKSGLHKLYAAGSSTNLPTKRAKLYIQTRDALQFHGPMTLEQASKHIGATPKHVYGHIRSLCVEQSAHISGWIGTGFNGNSPAAIYSFGPGEDVPRTCKSKPKAKSGPSVPKSVRKDRRAEKSRHIAAIIDMTGAAFRSVIVPGAPWPYRKAA